MPAQDRCHLARAVCRCAERRVCRLGETETINLAAAKYLNRLSDLLFVTARVLNVRAGRDDVLWQPGKNRQGASLLGGVTHHLRNRAPE